MRSKRIFHAVDSHTEGMPTRVITGGVGTIPGATMTERRLHFVEHQDPPTGQKAHPAEPGGGPGRSPGVFDVYWVR